MAKWTDYINPFKNPHVWNPLRDEKNEEKFKGKEKKKQKKYAKSYGKGLNKYIKDQKAYNKQQYGGPHGEKAFNKKMDAWYKKYGGESYQKHSALTGGQQSLLHELGKQGKKGLQNIRTPEDFKRVQDETLGRGGRRTLKDLMDNPGVSDPRRAGIFKMGQGGLENLLNNPSITDLQDMEGYQRGQSSINDLLSNNPEAFQRFAAPEMRRYQEQTIPDIIGRFGAGGQNNSALNSALANSGADLNERLGALRAGLQSEGRNQALQYGQARQAGQGAQAGIFGNAATSALNYANAPYSSQVANAQIRGNAAQGGTNYLDLYLKQQGLQANNIYNQNKQAGDFAHSALGVSPYNVIHRSPQAPTNNIITGGPKPVASFPGLPPQPQSYQPSWTSKIAEAAIPAAAGAAGAAFGAPIGESAGAGFSGFFNGNNTPKNNQMGW